MIDQLLVTFEYVKIIKVRAGSPSRDHYYKATWNQIVLKKDTGEITTLSDGSIHDILKNAEVRVFFVLCFSLNK